MQDPSLVHSEEELMPVIAPREEHTAVLRRGVPWPDLCQGRGPGRPAEPLKKSTAAVPISLRLIMTNPYVEVPVALFI